MYFNGMMLLHQFIYQNSEQLILDYDLIHKRWKQINWLK